MLFALWSTVSVAAQSAECDQRVPLADLISSPSRYEGKPLWVVAHVTIQFENMTACSSASETQAKNCLWLAIDDGPHQADRDYARYQSKLRHWMVFDGQTVAIHARLKQGASGHFGMWPGELASISELSGYKGGWSFADNTVAAPNDCVGVLPPPHESRGSDWMRTGNRELQQGNVDQAIADFGRAIALESRNGGYYIVRAQAKTKKRDYAGAIADYTQALGLVQDDRDVLYRIRAELKQRIGDIPGAAADLALARQLVPETSGVSAAHGYRRFDRPDIGLSFEYPSSWKPSPNLPSLSFSDPEGKEVRIALRVHPLNRSEPATAADYLVKFSRDLALEGGHLAKQSTIHVAGRDAEKLDFVEPHGAWGQAAGEEIVIPNRSQYWVASLFGKASDVDVIRPRFDRLVSGLQLGGPTAVFAQWGSATGGPVQAVQMLARNPEELHRVIQVFGRDLIGKVVPDSGLDFSASMLVAISLGQKPTGGYAVTIVDAVRRGNVLVVRYREHAPGPGEYVTQMFSAPFCLKVLPRGSGDTVLFERSKRAGND